MAASLLYCIGAAKAGTTWLAQALRGHDQAALPPVKETHYFDSLELGTATMAMDHLIQARQAIRDQLRTAQDEDTRTKITRRLQNMDRWLGLIGSQQQKDALYERLMMRSVGPNKRVVADVTPAYAMLSQATYTRMASLNGGDTRFLMILRDPVDRLWSNLSMSASHRAAKTGGKRAAIRNRLLESVLTNPDSAFLERSDYATTLTRLDAAVPASQRKTVFFEDLFSADTLAGLSGFMGLGSPLVGPAQKVNATTTAAIPAPALARLTDLLRPQYDDIKSRFGVLPQRWEDNLAQSMVTS